MDHIISSFNHSFRRLDADSRQLLDLLTDDNLYRRPPNAAESMTAASCGENLVRSAATVEKTFGGITTRLWDDPFEWTLPEKLSSKALILDYLDEVDLTRAKGFSLINNDAELVRRLPAPERMMSLAELLLETVALARHFQGRAFAVFQMISDQKLPRIDIP